ncbi:hypothetical protein LEP1GSC188_4914 [Leptospira weilii serovar Topaz str. LT2116]|uniref:Uncharacterized protein n=1 Tax=Leptospira weilii serovar Topaz str. LT2116 TaxID=1088540 RepID=M3FM45_9LEPT|nr:hypothetical protein LEP1GSC188_4914 [Leptospira weilii serovar Topaz str. LT2116]
MEKQTSQIHLEHSFFKINKNLLQTEFPNYQTFFSEDLEIYFFDHLRSKKSFIDLDRLENQDWKECRPDYSYSLIHQKVTFQIRWKVDSSCPKNCPFFKEE